VEEHGQASSDPNLPPHSDEIARFLMESQITSPIVNVQLALPPEEAGLSDPERLSQTAHRFCSLLRSEKEQRRHRNVNPSSRTGVPNTDDDIPF